MKTNSVDIESPLKAFDVNSIRKDFPILQRSVYGKPLVYLDNAATTQKPAVVIESLSRYYSQYNANIHRGVHFLSQEASGQFDDVRVKVQKFIQADSEKEIIFVRGTTEGVNLVASTYGRQHVGEGDEIIISAMEHHSNIVPWQLLCEEKKASLKIIPMTDDGELILDEYEKLFSARTKLVSVVHTSNSLGTINPLKAIIRTAHAHHAPVMVDAAQAVIHESINVQELDCDFLTFSGHKMLGPMGIGVLYGKFKLLDSMPPYQGGGEMIRSVSFRKTTYNDVPFRFEAGTPNVADVIGLGVAIDYLNQFDRKSAALHEKKLWLHASAELEKIKGLRLIGKAKDKTGIVSFVIEGLNALDVGMYLDTLGIAVRTGHHCTEPVMDRLSIPGTIRASFLFYNTMDEVAALVSGVQKAIQLLKK